MAGGHVSHTRRAVSCSLCSIIVFIMWVKCLFLLYLAFNGTKSNDVAYMTTSLERLFLCIRMHEPIVSRLRCYPTNATSIAVLRMMGPRITKITVDAILLTTLLHPQIRPAQLGWLPSKKIYQLEAQTQLDASEGADLRGVAFWGAGPGGTPKPRQGTTRLNMKNSPIINLSCARACTLDTRFS
jgi:hypothetical protein